MSIIKIIILNSFDFKIAILTSFFIRYELITAKLFFLIFRSSFNREIV